MVVIKKPAQEGAFVLICGAHPIEVLTNKVYAASSEMQFFNDGQTQLWVDNQESGDNTVITFVPPEQAIDGVSFEAVDQTWTVPFNSLVSFGPFSREVFSNAQGNLVFTVSHTTNILLWARSASR